MRHIKFTLQERDLIAGFVGFMAAIGLTILDFHLVVWAVKTVKGW